VTVVEIDDARSEAVANADPHVGRHHLRIGHDELRANLLSIRIGEMRDERRQRGGIATKDCRP